MNLRQPSKTQRAAWLRRAETLQRKTEALFADILTVTGEEHLVTDYADNVVTDLESLTDVLRTGSLTMWQKPPLPKKV